MALASVVRSKFLNLLAQGNVGFAIHQPYAPGHLQTLKYAVLARSHKHRRRCVRQFAFTETLRQPHWRWPGQAGSDARCRKATS